jgi:hypothetical protein
MRWGLLDSIFLKFVTWRPRAQGGPCSRPYYFWKDYNAFAIQRAWRAYLARRPTPSAEHLAAAAARRLCGAARRLHLWFRHCCCYKRLFFHPPRERAARRIQAVLRGHLVRRPRRAHAITVQRVWRGYQGRLVYIKLFNERRECVRRRLSIAHQALHHARLYHSGSVSTLQRWWRRCSRQRHLRRAVLRLQAFWRMHLARAVCAQLARRRSAVITLQRAFLLHCSRKLWRSLLRWNAASWAHHFPSPPFNHPLPPTRRTCAAQSIQRAWRRHRVSYLHWRLRRTLQLLPVPEADKRHIEWRAWHCKPPFHLLAWVRAHYARRIQRAWRWCRVRRALRVGSLRRWAQLVGWCKHLAKRHAAQRLQRWLRALHAVRVARYRRWRWLMRRARGVVVAMQSAWRGFVGRRAALRLRNPAALRFKTLVVVQLGGREKAVRLRACLPCWLAGSGAGCTCGEARVVECCICLQEWEGEGVLAAGAPAPLALDWKVLACGHAFHSACLLQWVESQARGFVALQACSSVVRCPLCKKAATRVVRWAWLQEDSEVESRVIWAPPMP